MSTLTGTKIKDTYPGLLKTVDNEVVGATEKQITDGEGNAIPISMGTSGVSFTGAADFTGATVTGLPETGVQSVVAGTNVTVDSTDPANPVVSADETGVQSVVAGTNVSVDSTDPANPIISAAGGGGGIEGTNYLFVAANGTDIENATELQAAYDEAKTLTPSTTNRITVIAAPGNYNFETNVFVMDTQFIDLVSLDGNRSVLFNHPLNTGNRTEGSINITANNVFVKGVNVLTKAFTIATNLNLLKVENCEGGRESFNAAVISGTFIECTGDSTIFGTGNQTVSGTFIRCFGRFGQTGSTSSGTFTDCVGTGGSFGGRGTASGTFTNCTVPANAANAFGGGVASAIASGTFIDCTALGGGDTFGGRGLASGTFIRCRASASGAFGGSFNGTASGTFTDCIATFSAFGGGTRGQATGTFTNCVAQANSFGGIDSSTTRLGLASGTFTNCIGGNNSFGRDITVTGTFTNCIAGSESFGAGTTDGVLEGKLLRCTLTAGTFQTPTGTGKIVLGIDGNDDIINLTA